MPPSNNFWEEKYKEHAPRMLGICRRYLGSTALAEDIMHEAFIQAIQKYHTYGERGLFSGWLAKVTVNTALMHLRKNKGSATFSLVESALNSELSIHDNDSDDASPKQLIEAAHFSQDELLQAIDVLPTHHRTVFNMYVMDGYTHKEIGKLLDISAGTSKSHLARARKKLQDILYKRALERKRKERKRRAYIFIPFLSSRIHYIDKYFYKNLINLSIEPISTPIGIEKGLSGSLPSKATTLASGLQMPLVVSLAAILAVGSTIGIIFHFNSKPANSFESENVLTFPDSTQRLVNSTDSLIISLLPEPIDSSTLTTYSHDTINKAPIVIMRQVIVRDTIIKYIDED